MRKNVAEEKERKARTLLLMAIPKDHLRRFHGMDDAKDIWAAIKTRFGGNANSKKMQKAVLKQQFEAFTISSKESLERERDLDQIDDMDLEEMDLNWQIAMIAHQDKEVIQKTGVKAKRVDGK
ncbi:hypothetical protein Tco_0464067 [Tanacetum coccineum]